MMKYDLEQAHDMVLGIRLRSAHRRYVELIKRGERLKFDAPGASELALMQATDLIPYCRAIHHEMARRGLEIQLESGGRVNIISISEMIDV